MPMHQINMNWQASSQVLNPRHQHPPQCWEGARNLHPVTCLETVVNVVICIVVRDCGKPIPFPASHHHHAIYAYLYVLDMMWNRRNASL